MRTTAAVLATACVLGLSACTQAAMPTKVETSATATVDRGNLGVSPATALFVPGQTERFAALAAQIFTKDLASVTWTVDNPAIASVTADGTLTAHTTGFTWLRASGPEGRAAHPISVSMDAITVATGSAWLEGCSAGSPATCSMLMKGASSSWPLQLRYRRVQGQVIAEFWYGNDLNTSALVGVEATPGHFTFAAPALLAPVISRGAGGCCSTLSEILVSGTSGQLTGGGFKSTSASHVLRYRIAAQ